MELKDYQQKALAQVKQYLGLLEEWRAKADANPELEIDYPAKAWEKAEVRRPYFSRLNGLNKPLPAFCLKIPTGGGKTFLAVKAIDLFNTIYRKSRTGLILWIVPTNQIYAQTLKQLRDREHPYRQHLDITSGGRTMIVEKGDQFSPLDIEESLVVMMLMLPSANRRTKETLRLFQDNGGFQSFFPAEDDIAGQQKMLEQYPNLDTFGEANSFWQRQIKTSLGNTLRLLEPVIILDEGHKAYSDGAQETLRGFNPSLIMELSATPSDQSNVLVDILGIELHREEMIKLDLHVINKVSWDWKDTLAASVEKRNLLEQKSQEYQANTGNYIRPICLIQVERTGKEQRDGQHIHSEDVREYLIKITGIPPEQVAVTSAELKEIEGIDLLSPDCPIRYIITNRALQEGWDCPFAYLLTILTNPTAQNALTQLVGRILRQPFARKTGVTELDESYVFAFQQRATSILANVKAGFGREGLGDLTNRVVEDNSESATNIERDINVRHEFERAAREIVLPVFMINHDSSWRPVSYEGDIASRINWQLANLEPVCNLTLLEPVNSGLEIAVQLSSDKDELIQFRRVNNKERSGISIDPVFLARHLLDTVPNPWVAFEMGNTVITRLCEKYDIKIVTGNFVFIIEELRKHLASEKDRLAKDIFQALLKEGVLRFVVIGNDFSYKLPRKMKSKSPVTLTQANGQPLQKSLFDYVPSEDFNEEEKKVAWFLEEQKDLFFWYRNRARHDYAIQGWQKQRIYPDFIFTYNKDATGTFDNVYILETKGIHLKNEDTDYKKSVFDVCNKEAKQKSPDKLPLALQNKTLRFEIVFSDEWQRKLNEMLA